jgi:hypothetical protein
VVSGSLLPPCRFIAPPIGVHCSLFCGLRGESCGRTRDNGFVYVPTGFVNQAQLAEKIDATIRNLNPQEVVHVAYSIGNDSTDDPALFFRIVLTDAASREDRLADVTGRVESTLSTSIRPIQNWGLTPYFSFRSYSEQRGRNDPAWS